MYSKVRIQELGTRIDNLDETFKGSHIRQKGHQFVLHAYGISSGFLNPKVTKVRSESCFWWNSILKQVALKAHSSTLGTLDHLKLLGTMAKLIVIRSRN